jgi:ubiquinone/menaquinone biosynthesis C-methylase UbiE
MPEAQTNPQVSPALFFNTINSYQRTEALKAAIVLDVFSAIRAGNTTAAELAPACGAAERGMRILCDYLVIMGFLTKEDGRYGLTPDSAMFLDRKSPAYLGGTIDFLLSPVLTGGFKDIAAAVRKGGTVMDQEGTITPDNPVWVDFARAMAPMMALPAHLMAELVDPSANSKLRILDLAAGHGLFGLAFAKRNPQAEVTAVDWPNVLAVAEENAAAAGVSERYQTNPGSAFDVDYGTGFDLVLFTNFLHHFDPPTCEVLLRKAHAALAPGGRAVTLEFVPNEDRVSPPEVASFSMMMLGSTPSGDAYTFPDLDKMMRNAGFARNELHQLPPTLQNAIISHK